MLNRTISDQASVITTSTGNIGGIIQSLTALSETTKGSRGHIATLKGQAEKGQADIEAAIGSMSVIRESTGIIAGMIVMINDVAERTDLLAMNASIEAAHAGAAGKGFEVIAGEIRNLAVQTKNNARHISESLNLLKARMDDTERNTVETYGTIRSFIGGVFGLSESLNGFIETLATITQGNRRVTESLGNLDKVSLDINGVLASITGSLSEIARRMEEIDTLSSVTKVSVTEISKGIEDISNSMSGLTILGSKNSQVVSALEKELIRFKTRT
jgi:methyl-accepting chemotaxis protein